jgi:hypothetical protein
MGVAAGAFFKSPEVALGPDAQVIAGFNCSGEAHDACAQILLVELKNKIVLIIKLSVELVLIKQDLGIQRIWLNY